MGFQFSVSSFWFAISGGNGIPVSGFWFLVSGFRLPISSFRFQVSGFWRKRDSSFWLLAYGFRFPVSASGGNGIPITVFWFLAETGVMFSVSSFQRKRDSDTDLRLKWRSVVQFLGLGCLFQVSACVA